MAEKAKNADVRERRKQNSGAAGIIAPTHRFFDGRLKAWLVKVLPGNHYITDDPQEIIVTVLGSCVAACIRDPKTGIGGMNHFMLPDGRGREGVAGEAMRYGHYAMEVLINGILSTGCPRDRLEIKVFGGGHVIAGSSSMVGGNNAQFVHDYLADEGLSPIVSDLGGNYPRRIEYSPATGKVKRLLLKRQEDKELLRDEFVFRKKMAEKKEPEDSGGDIELFG